MSSACDRGNANGIIKDMCSPRGLEPKLVLSPLSVLREPNPDANGVPKVVSGEFWNEAGPILIVEPRREDVGIALSFLFFALHPPLNKNQQYPTSLPNKGKTKLR